MAAPPARSSLALAEGGEKQSEEGGGEGCSGARWCVSVKVVASAVRVFNYGRMQRFGKLLVGMRDRLRSEVVLEKDVSALKIQEQVREISRLSSSFLPSVAALCTMTITSTTSTIPAKCPPQLLDN
jgi:hypothetical protein